jgi:predicted DNA binding CopG/RHH family protein
MKQEYDFEHSEPNPYARKVKTPVTIRLDVQTVQYFKDLSAKVGLPYQTLINSYLTDCAVRHVKPELSWG